MKTLIQQTDSDRNIRFLEKVATCLPGGNVSMTDDVFDEATYEQQFVVDHMKEGKEKMEACLRFADYCIDCGVYDKALHYYSYVLEESVFEGRIKNGYQDLSFIAYQGVVCCNSCENEYTWEVSSEILKKYRDLFEKDNNEWD